MDRDRGSFRGRAGPHQNEGGSNAAAGRSFQAFCETDGDDHRHDRYDKPGADRCCGDNARAESDPGSHGCFTHASCIESHPGGQSKRNTGRHSDSDRGSERLPCGPGQRNAHSETDGCGQRLACGPGQRNADRKTDSRGFGDSCCQGESDTNSQADSGSKSEPGNQAKRNAGRFTYRGCQRLPGCVSHSPGASFSDRAAESQRFDCAANGPLSIASSGWLSDSESICAAADASFSERTTESHRLDSTTNGHLSIAGCGRLSDREPICAAPDASFSDRTAESQRLDCAIDRHFSIARRGSVSHRDPFVTAADASFARHRLAGDPAHCARAERNHQAGRVAGDSRQHSRSAAAAASLAAAYEHPRGDSDSSDSTGDGETTACLDPRRASIRSAPRGDDTAGLRTAKRGRACRNTHAQHPDPGSASHCAEHPRAAGGREPERRARFSAGDRGRQGEKPPAKPARRSSDADADPHPNSVAIRQPG